MAKIYPRRGQTYDLKTILTELDLRDSPFLQVKINGEMSVIQTSHIMHEELLKIPEFANSKWGFVRETHEWIPLFLYSDRDVPIETLVDIEEEIDPYRRWDDPVGYWVTPKAFPREQYYKKDKFGKIVRHDGAAV